MTLPKQARALIGLMALAALAATAYAGHSMQSLHDYRFWELLLLASATARLKVKLPSLTGNMSVNLPFLLVAVVKLDMLAALLVALPSCVVQCIPAGGGKPKLVQMIFNLSTTAVAVASASLIGVHFVLLGVMVFFLVQTVPVACIIRFTEGGTIHQIWASIAHYSFPFYVLGAGIASIATSATTQFGWQVLLVGLPVLYAIYRSYLSYFLAPGVVRRPSA